MRNYQNLSPVDFEELVRDLLQADMGIPLESFGPGADQGIDLRYASGGTKIIVQAKRYLDSSLPTLLTNLKAERPKVEKLKPTRYILAIAKVLTPNQKKEVLAIFKGLPLVIGDIKTLKEIDSLLNRFPAVEKAHFKLWLSSINILERIIFAGIHNRTRAEMAEIGDLIPKFVGNAGIADAEKILKKQRILIVSGEPGVGKSSLARFLISSHANQGWKIFVIDSIEKAFDVTTSDDKTLVFFDDFLGQVELTPDFLRGMDAQLPVAFRDIQRRKNLRFILTTRSYILRQARSKARRLADDEFKPTEFVLKIGHYSRAERARILYNHLYFSKISKKYRDQLVDGDLVVRIIDHKNFNPRLINVLTSPQYVQLESGSVRETLLRVLDNPKELWDLPYREQLGAESRALLIALFFNRANTPIDTLEKTFKRFLPAFVAEVSPADVLHKYRRSLHELEGSFVSIGNGQVSFANPGVRDYLATVVKADGLIKTLLPNVETFVELQTMWQARKKRPMSLIRAAEITELFLAAFERCRTDESLDVLAQLDLGIQMHSELGEDGFSDAIKATADDIPRWDFDDWDITPIEGIYRTLKNSNLNKKLVKRAQGKILSAVQTVLEKDATRFTLDEVRTLFGVVRQYSSLPDDVAKSAKSFLERWADSDLQSDIDSASDVEEVDSLEREIGDLLLEYGVYKSGLSDIFDKKRTALADEDEEDDPAPYTPVSAPSDDDNSITDSEITSMFSGLRSPAANRRSKG